MCIIDSNQSDKDMRAAIEDFQRSNPMMYIQRKLDLSGRDLGMIPDTGSRCFFRPIGEVAGFAA